MPLVRFTRCGRTNPTYQKRDVHPSILLLSGSAASAFSKGKKDNEDCRHSKALPRLQPSFPPAFPSYALRYASPSYFVQEEGFDFQPVADAGVAGDGFVVGGVVQNAGAGEEFELTWVVVDEKVGAEDGFVAAEDDVGVGDEREVALEPAVLGVERAGDFHGGGGDEDLVVALHLGEDARCVGHDVKVFEEVFGAEIVVEDGVMALGDDLPEALATEVFLGEVAVVVAVIAEEMFGDGVGHDLVHVDADAFAGGVHSSIIGDE